jgi:hypothetical protein
MLVQNLYGAGSGSDQNFVRIRNAAHQETSFYQYLCIQSEMMPHSFRCSYRQLSTSIF